MQDLTLTTMWNRSLSSAGYHFVDVLVQGGRYFAASTNLVYELDVITGAELSRLTVQDSGNHPVLMATDGQSLFVGAAGEVNAVALDDWSRLKWSTWLPGIGKEVVTVLATGGRLFAGSYGYAFELDPSSGAPLHSIELPFPVRDPLGNYTTSLACDGQTLFVGCHGYVYGVALDNWNQAKWEASVAGYNRVDVLASNGMLFAGSLAHVYRLDPTSGAQIHTLALLDPEDATLLDHSVRLATDGATLYCGAVGFAYAIASTGDWSSWKWHVMLQGADRNVRFGVVDLAVQDGRLYAGNNGVVTEMTTDTGLVIDRKVLTSSFQTPFPDYTTRVAPTGEGVLVGVHGYAYRVLSLVGSALAVGLNQDAALEVFAVGPGGAVQQCVETASGWSAWSAMDGGFSSGPGVVRSSNGQLSLFGRGLDNALWYTQHANDGWTSWASLGGSLTSAPDVLLNPQQQIVVFARMSGNDIARVGRGANGWAQWLSLGGSLNSGPSTVLDGNGVLHVFADGSDNSLMQCTKSGNSWSDWRSLQGVLIGGPVAISRPNGNITVFARGTDNAVWLRQRINGTWSAWQSLQGNVSSTPAAVLDGNGRFAVFGRGGDKALWCIQQTSGSGWTSWQSLGGTLTSMPVAIVDNARAVNVFARGASGDVVHMRQTGSGWAQWESLGGMLIPV